MSGERKIDNTSLTAFRVLKSLIMISRIDRFGILRLISRFKIPKNASVEGSAKLNPNSQTQGKTGKDNSSNQGNDKKK